jgi:NADH:ubiquinone oxidoreductase subunit E
VKVINVCIGSACHLKGSYEVIQKFQEKIKEHNLEEEVELKAAFCLGECTKSVSVKIDNSPVISVSPESAGDIFEKYVVQGE